MLVVTIQGVVRRRKYLNVVKHSAHRPAGLQPLDPGSAQAATRSALSAFCHQAHALPNRCSSTFPGGTGTASK